MSPGRLVALSAALAGAVSLAQADTGKLLLTGGVSSISGAAGGGLTPWAAIGSNATEGEVGVSALATRAATQDYSLNSYGVVVGLHERVELSLARQDFDAAPAVALNGIAPFGVAPGQHIHMDLVGVKVKVAGDAVLDADTWMPQIAVGLKHKRVHSGSLQSVQDFLGTRRNGTDVYVSATKLLLAQSLLLNGTLPYTNANQNGLLGFGAAVPRKSGRSLQPEFSVAYVLSKNLAVGAEYRLKPNSLQALGAAAGLGAARRRLERPVYCLGAPQAPVADAGLCGPGPHRARRDGRPPPDGLLPVSAGGFLMSRACGQLRSLPPLFKALMPSHTLIALGLAACNLLTLPALAQSTPARATSAATASVPAKAVAPPGLYQALGEKAGISRLMDNFVARVFKDPRIGDQFKETKPQALQVGLTDQICQLSDGPCVYEGDDMRVVHADMEINKCHFNALVELLQTAMDAQSIPFAQQNRLLALLAPMHRDIITV